MHTCTHGWVDVDFLQCQSAFASAVCGRMQSHISARKSLRVFLTPIPHSGPRTHSPLLPHLSPHQQIPRLQWLVCRSRASHARGTRVSRVLGSMHLSKPAMHASPPASRTPAQSRPAARPRTTSRSQPRIHSDAAPAPPVAQSFRASSLKTDSATEPPRKGFITDIWSQLDSLSLGYENRHPKERARAERG